MLPNARGAGGALRILSKKQGAKDRLADILAPRSSDTRIETVPGSLEFRHGRTVYICHPNVGSIKCDALRE